MTGKYLLCDDCENVNVFESEEMEKAWAILFADKERTFSVVQISPAVRVSIGEKFGMQSGEDSMGKIATALCAMGADAVVDLGMGADIVAIKDAKTLLKRKEQGVKTPLISSKCSFVADYIRAKYPDLETSETASESSVNAILLKDYYKEQTGKTVRVISIEPCKEKKFLQGVDAVITAAELEGMLGEVEEVGVSVRTLKKRALDMPLGLPTGGAYITDCSGGMAEAVARCLSKDSSVSFVDKLGYSGFYSLKERREASVTVGENTFRFAIVCDMDEAEALIKEIREGKTEYDYVEITACKGGCICGNKLPEILQADGERLRRKGLQELDKSRSARVASVSSVAIEMKKRYDAWLRKKQAGELEAETDVESVRIDDGFTAKETETVKDVASITVETSTEIIETPETVEVNEEIETAEEMTLVEEEIAVSEVPAEESVETEEESTETVATEAETVVTEKKKVDTYYQRMSKKDRRKMKRANKGK